MYDFECSSDSSASSTLNESNNLFNRSNQDDEDSESTIIIEDDITGIDNSTLHFKGTDSKIFDDEFSLLGMMDNKNTLENVTTNCPSTQYTIGIYDQFKDLNKPPPYYCKNNSTLFSNNKVDSELESILLKYGSPDLIPTDRNGIQKTITSTYTNNKENELIEVSSDEEIPHIQIIHKTSSTIIKSQAQKDKIGTEEKELSRKCKVKLNEEDKNSPSIRVKSSRSESVTFGSSTVNVEEQLSHTYSQIGDEDDDKDLPKINIRTCKQPTSLTKAEYGNKYETIFNGNSFINVVANSVNNYPKEDKPDLNTSSKKKRKLNSVENNEKIDKVAIQAKKREEAETAKKLKQALLSANRNMKPEECMKFITVILDSDITNEKYGGDILNVLQTADVTYRVQSQIIPHTVTWNRKVETHGMDAKEQLTTTTDIMETNEVLCILNWKQVTELVHSRSLVTHIKSLQSILVNKKFSLAIYGIENYFKYQKSQKQRAMRSEITRTSQKANIKYDKIYKDAVKISKKQLEFALTELQLLCCCCHRMVETAHDLGAMIAHFTKAIAQAPYKLEKQRKQQEEEWYMSGDNKDCVRVDKNGNGLQRLWQQQLTTFPLARLEHAEAIVAKYPTPTSLMTSYSHCTQTEGEKLLQDIPIRRAAGPLTTVRKIGPELSKKMFKFFNSTDGNCVL